MIERRKQPRKAFRESVQIAPEQGSAETGVCVDVSLGGMFIETGFSPPYGSKVTLLIQLPALPDSVAIASIVRWKRTNGIGVQFEPMGGRETHALVALLATLGAADGQRR